MIIGLLMTAALAAVYCFSGRLLCGRLALPGALDRFVVFTAAGMGFTSLLYFVCCALGVSFFVGLGTAVAAAVFGVVKYGFPKRLPKISLGFVLLALYFLAILLAAAVPVTMADWDSLAYHLSVPKLFLAHGGFYNIPFMSHSNFPMGAEMLSLPGLAAGNILAAKLHGFIFFVLAVLAAGITARRFFGKGAFTVAILAACSIPIFAWEATTAYIDTAACLYTVLALYFVLAYMNENKRSDALMCGVMCGLAAGCKYTGLLVLLLMFVWVLAAGKENRLRDAFLCVLAAFVVCGGWYIKSLVLTGNPVYPFFYGLFGGRGWTADLAANYSALQGKFGVGHGLLYFLRLPYDLTVNSAAFYDRPGFYVGPIMLVAVLTLFLGKYRDKKFSGTVAFFLLNLIAWFALTQQSRYLLPALCMAAVIIGAAVAGSSTKLPRFVCLAVFAATAVFSLLTMSGLMTVGFELLTGKMTETDYLMENIDRYSADRYINNALPKGSKTALCGDTRGFFLKGDYVWADPGHNRVFDEKITSLAALKELWKREGVTHLSINFNFYPKAEDAEGVAKYVYEAAEKGVLLEEYPPVNGVGVYKIIYD